MGGGEGRGHGLAGRMSSVILPTDDLPSVFSKEVRLKFKKNELNTEFVFMAATRGFFFVSSGIDQAHEPVSAARD